VTDIVTRLREYARTVSFNDPPEDYLVWQAADEIERLREQLASLQASSGYEAATAQVTIERLRAALQQIADDATPGDDNYCSEIARAALEPKP
jgi:hypothetical protein